MEPLLTIKNLKTRFHTEDGVVKAVNGISYSMDHGEVLVVRSHQQALIARDAVFHGKFLAWINEVRILDELV